nr:hypothetical protein [Sphingomonas sp. Y57]
MASAGDVRIPIRHDCGHEFEISLVGHDPETMQFTCPGCGVADGFTPEQAAEILAQYEAAKAALAKAFR